MLASYGSPRESKRLRRTRRHTWGQIELKSLFKQAVRAIGFYKAQRKKALMALESLRRGLASRRPKPPTP
jgi:hypothetical protein